MVNKQDVLESSLPGTWYSADPAELKAEIRGYLSALTYEQQENVMAVVLPHAGYKYSGFVMASGINQLVGRSFSRVIVIGPSHHVSMVNEASIPAVKCVKTPLGCIELDRVFIDKLDSALFVSRPAAHAEEHSVQIELPFLQEALGTFKLVPIVVGQLDEESCRAIGHELLKHMDKETLVVISSDFTHYGAAFDYVPFKKNIAENLDKLDVGAFKKIQTKDLSGFLEYIEEKDATICGRSSIGVLLGMLPENSQVRMLKYDTSGHITGDWSRCVSYMSILVTGRWAVGEELSATRKKVTLTKDEKLTLLDLARQALDYQLQHGRAPSVDDLSVAISPAMRQVMGAFVTLKWHGQLRGCIGEIFPERALYEAVIDNAINAGINDPRFAPVSSSELEELEFEISALGGPVDVASYKDIIIGTHGIVLKKGFHSAVFLPQVAIEQGWDLTQTLAHLAEKAGLDKEAWKEGCQFRVFEALVFGE
jgi:MEMO1 family protein